jgi:peptide-methionine (R)-S-oxide reductase
MSQKKTDEEWRKELSPEQYQVLRQHGTERAFSGPYWDTKEPGVYLCAGCGTQLFSSDHKYDSGSGWPSYTQPMGDGAVETTEDVSHGMVRTEVHCARCGGHLGHVFPDGPGENGLRYCINGTSLKKVDK